MVVQRLNHREKEQTIPSKETYDKKKKKSNKTKKKKAKR